MLRALRLDGLDALMNPRGVAVIGASSQPDKIGGRPLRFLKESGFAGGVYPVNSRYEQVQDLRCYPDLASIEGPVDLALIAVPRDAALAAVRECVSKGVKVATVFSANFAETDEEGGALQREIAEVAAAGGLRLLGPNCLGSSNRRNGVTATFAAVESVAKPVFHWNNVGFVSQSGAIAAHCVLAALDRGVELDPWISTGNEADIDFAEALATLALDDGVQVIAGYVEGCRDGAKLREALALAQERRKPVILLKVGTSEIGAQAAASHTASLVGSEEIFDALFRQYNVCRVESIEELLDLAYAFSLGRPPSGRKVGLLTGSGGVGILMADAAQDFGLEVPALPEAAQRRLKELWPLAGVGNPVDTTAQVMNRADLLTAFLEVMVEEGDFDMIMLFLSYMGQLQPWSDGIVDALLEARKKFPHANLIVSMTSRPEVLEEVESLGIAVFEDPTKMLRTMSTVARVHEGFDRVGLAMATQGHVTDERLAGSGPVNEVEAKRILADAGIPVVRETVVTSSTEAATEAAEIGFPVVMKVVSPQILHKTEVGGVVLNIGSEREAAQAYENIISSAMRHVPEAHIEGVLIAPMVSGGVETIMGVQNDPTFGPAVMFGLGGVFVEVLKDVTYRLAPFDVAVAEEMVREIKGFDLLDGARGAEPCDIEALAGALSALSHFAVRHSDRIESIDLNPVLAKPKGQGVIAVDALIMRKDVDDQP